MLLILHASELFMLLTAMDSVIELPRYGNFLCHMSWKFISRYEHMS